MQQTAPVAPPGWEPKDVVTAIVAGLALGLSLWSTWRSRFDRRQDELRVVRNQLTDTMLAISEARMKRREVNAMSSDSQDEATRKNNSRGALTDRLRFLCHQARFLADQLPDRVASIEYSLIGFALHDAGETSEAAMMHRAALGRAETSRDRASVLRSLGRIQFDLERPIDARVEFRSAIKVLAQDESNERRQDIVETLLRWAEAERWMGDIGEVPAILAEAHDVVSQITNERRRLESQRNVETRESFLTQKSADAKNPRTTLTQ